VRNNASDVHIEPFEKRLCVRMRIDGVMHDTLEPPRSIAALMISRIKVMARLDISEKRLPQDGRISLRVAGRPVDVRVSTLPSGHGERVVMRLLDKEAGRLDLEQLGMAPRDRDLLNDLIHRPHGILLVTGPTGSGKTTTLYAALTRLNDATRTILTVEDPIEYYLDGVGQTQVNTRVDLTFARGLRAILRQDPDVVLVGEIRDLETAEIAVQASLTGHLVLSTLHTNTAIGAVTRLRDMGVEPFLLSSSLVGIAAQRLVRLLCTHCRAEHRLTEAECALFELDPGDPPLAYRAVGCERCNGTGYWGRSGIYELIALDDRMRTAIHDGASEFELDRQARRKGPGIRSDGLRRILAGDTSVEEVLRVTPAHNREDDVLQD
jgi:general secretion pathway protein E